MGHIGERGDSGGWNTFEFEIVTDDGEQYTISIDPDDMPDGVDIADWWDDFFDYLDWYADEYDTDYDNKYGES